MKSNGTQFSALRNEVFRILFCTIKKIKRKDRRYTFLNSKSYKMSDTPEINSEIFNGENSFENNANNETAKEQQSFATQTTPLPKTRKERRKERKERKAMEKMEKRREKNENKSTSFGKIMLASAVGALIALVLVGIFKLLMLIGIIGAIGSGVPEVADNSFLKIDLTKPMTERSPSDLTSLISKNSDVGFSDVLRSISSAADDKRIKGIYLYMGSGYSLSWGRSAELREALADFAKSGKPIFVYADYYSQQGYFTASVADSIYLNPSGLVEFRGIGAEGMFFKEMLDRLAVNMTLVRPKSNSFKSAGETYTMNHYSDSNKTQLREYISSIWQYALEGISKSRNISISQLNTYADSLSAAMPTDALKNRLVDRLCFESDIKATMKEKYGSEQTVDVSDYIANVKSQQKKPKKNDNRIAVIYAEGDVVTGSGLNTAVYSDKITMALEKAAEDDNIKAIVLRVNSPGGAVTASEIMTNAVKEAKKRKPVIVSMGDVAASAGYEISCNADYIVAEPTTITGSIGVFATIPEVGGTLKKYLGITTDTIKTNANSTALSIMRPMSPRTLELMQRNVEDFYKVFVDRVAKGRGLSYDFVDSIARGRVWTGRDALKLGLVDELGGLDDAIRIAAERANISQYIVVDFPEDESFLEELKERSKESSGTAKADAIKLPTSDMPVSTLPHAGDGVWMSGNIMMDVLNNILDTQGLQARVEFFIITE